MAEVKTTKKWYESKTKIGALLAGIGAICTTVGAMLQGTLEPAAGITALITEVGVVVTVLGLRDALPLK